MTAPRLETFYSGTRIQETGYSIYKFMQRSSPPLTMLHLVRSVDEETLINILALLPTLKDLHLAEFVVSSRLFEALNVFEDSTTARVVGAAGNDVICPEMRGLRLSGTSFRSNAEDDTRMYTNAFVAMIRSRCFILKTFQTISYVYRSVRTFPIPLLDSDTPEALKGISDNLINGSVRIKGDGALPDPLTS